MGYVWDAEGRGLGVLLDKEGEQRCIAAAVLSAGAISLHKEHGLLGSHLGGVACVCLVLPAKLSWALPYAYVCLCCPDFKSQNAMGGLPMQVGPDEVGVQSLQ